jgi:ribonuclease J
MQICIHRGTHEIGGSCVEISVDNTRVVLDVGLPLDDLSAEKHEPAAHHSRASRTKKLGVNIDVPGLFSEGTRVNAVLLSHAHADHSGLLGEILKDISVYMTRGTSKMMLAGFAFAGQPYLPSERTVIVEPGKTFSIGNLNVTAYPVDHSSFGAVAFLVEGNGRRALYSGDIRLHGRKPGMARQLIHAVTSKPLDVLLMEGTHFGRGDKQEKTEAELEADIEQDIKNSASLVLACFSPLYVDRLVTFYRATKHVKRLFVIDPYTAYVLHMIKSECRVPDPFATSDILIHWTANFEKSRQRSRVEKLYPRMLTRRIETGKILRDLSQYVMVFRPSLAESVFGASLPKGTCCIYSYWEGYLNKPEWTTMREWVEQGGGRFIQHHTSGHIFKDGVARFVQALKPRSVVPVHTFNPDVFAEYIPNTQVLEDGVEFTVP